MNQDQKTSDAVWVVVGAGPGNGAAFARQFAEEGHRVAQLARNLERVTALAEAIPDACGFACDVTDPSSIATAFATIVRDMGPVGGLICNAGKGVWGDVLGIDAGDFERAWQVNVRGAFLAAQHVLPSMVERQSGTIIFVGATASLRGGAGAAAFASAKAAQRSLAESIARAYGPKGVHTCLMVVDAVVGEPLMREHFADRPDSFFCEPDAIADAALKLARQKPSAWTFQLDLRPFAELW